MMTLVMEKITVIQPCLLSRHQKHLELSMTHVIHLYMKVDPLLSLLPWVSVNLLSFKMHCAIEIGLINNQMYACSILPSCLYFLSLSMGGEVFILQWLH